MYEKVVIEYANDRQKHRKNLNHAMQHEVEVYALSVKKVERHDNPHISLFCSGQYDIDSSAGVRVRFSVPESFVKNSVFIPL